jgi:hypothetical protein
MVERPVGPFLCGEGATLNRFVRGFWIGRYLVSTAIPPLIEGRQKVAGKAWLPSSRCWITEDAAQIIGGRMRTGGALWAESESPGRRNVPDQVPSAHP